MGFYRVELSRTHSLFTAFILIATVRQRMTFTSERTGIHVM